MTREPLVSDLLSDNKYTYAKATHEWREYIIALVADCRRDQLKLVQSFSRGCAVWEISAGYADTITLYVHYGTVRRVDIKQTWDDYRAPYTDIQTFEDCEDLESTAHITIRWEDMGEFGLSLRVPDAWEYLQVIHEECRRCPVCLEPKTAMCTCLLPLPKIP